MLLTRLAEAGDLTASGVAYAVITMPVFELVIVQFLKKTRSQESALICFFLTAVGRTSLKLFFLLFRLNHSCCQIYEQYCSEVIVNISVGTELIVNFCF